VIVEMILEDPRSTQLLDLETLGENHFWLSEFIIKSQYLQPPSNLILLLCKRLKDDSTTRMAMIVLDGVYLWAKEALFNQSTAVDFKSNFKKIGELTNSNVKL